MNYSKLLRGFTKEFGQFSQYKKLGQPLKTLAIVGMLPFLIFTFALIGIMYVYVFLFNCIASAVEYLEHWLKDFKKDVSNGIAEAVVYLVTLPVIYVFRCILSLFAFTYYILWFEMMCVTYISSLAGIRWQPFISSAIYEDEIVVVAKTKKRISRIIITIIFALFCFVAMFKIILFIISKSITASDFETYRAYIEFLDSIVKVNRFVNVMDWIYTLFASIAVPIVFKKSIIITNIPQVNEIQASNVDTEPKKDLEEEFPEF